MEFLYTVINFILLAALLYIVGRKTVSGMFSSRLERINSGLDEAEVPFEEEPVDESGNIYAEIIDLAASSVKEEEAELDLTLSAMEKQFEENAENMRRESLLSTRTALVDKTIEKAREIMASDSFREKLVAQEDTVADAIISLIKLTPGDMLYLTKKGVLYVTVTSAYPLKDSTIDKLKEATDNLLAAVGGKSSFLVKDNDERLIGGFRLRIGDTVYDYSVYDRLYRLERALNDRKLTETDSKSIIDGMKKAVNEIVIDVDIFQVGRVLTVSDGICWLDGLSDIMYGELVEFVDSKDRLRGMVMDVQPDKIGCMVFGKFDHIESLSRVRRLDKMASVAVGEELLGRVVNPLGTPLDGKGRLWTTETRSIECHAPAIPDRKSVSIPLETGIKAIDALVPIGRGQRELIIGDRQTGKTSIAIDTIINQKGKDVYCIYVAIGQKESSVAAIVAKLEEHGAMNYTTVVLASASDSASLQYIAPFSGTAMAEYYMYKGKDVLIVYDDLSKHAVAYREISLLLHRPSGREAYPGDIFYLHSRLLERSARLSEEAGGGSITALPVIETLAGDISAYIPTNVISITDGQIFLETELFNAGQRPAINVGLSVSRVGGAAQTKFMKQVSSHLRTSLAQYRELATFTQFGSEIDDSTKATLTSGEQMMAVLRQDRFSPMPSYIQALVIYAVGRDAACNYSSENMWLFEEQFVNWFKVSHSALLEKLKEGGKLDADTEKELQSCIEEFKAII